MNTSDKNDYWGLGKQSKDVRFGIQIEKDNHLWMPRLRMAILELATVGDMLVAIGGNAGLGGVTAEVESYDQGWH